jgi:hypothetical protein
MTAMISKKQRLLQAPKLIITKVMQDKRICTLFAVVAHLVAHDRLSSFLRVKSTFANK